MRRVFHALLMIWVIFLILNPLIGILCIYILSIYAIVDDIRREQRV
ncbi:MAG: hypothetical protein J7L20_05935 [Thermoplasmata archaeon]|nr:hypothetical protein [Thermoplasmata archaeon]